jgi:chemosensory pili system protein ChpC
MSSANDEIYSLLVPLNQKRLIVPRACISEVIRYAPLQASDAAHPAWLRGMINWNGKHIPVISFEELAGLVPGEIGGRTRVAIIASITGRLSAGHFGVLTEGFPQLVRVNREVIQPAAGHPWPEHGPVICQIRMINEYPLIPDIEVIEDMLEEAARPGPVPLS